MNGAAQKKERIVSTVSFKSARVERTLLQRASEAPNKGDVYGKEAHPFRFKADAVKTAQPMRKLALNLSTSVLDPCV